MKSHYYLFALLVLIMSSLACTLPWTPVEETSPSEEILDTEPVPPTEIPEPPAPTEQATQESFVCGSGMAAANAFSVEFCYPEEYTNGFMQVRVPEYSPSEELPPWGIHPEMIEITLSGYPVANQYHDPVIRIYPVAGFIALEPRIQIKVNDLQSLLTSQDPNPENIPFVPIFNAAQMMGAQVTYLDFYNGKGVRFITQYGQAAMPISNDSAFYAFIGLTDDGEYLISATLPINHPLFSKNIFTEPQEGWETFVENFTPYISTMETDLLTQTQESFFPNLSPLDEMMASFLIPPGTLP